MDKIKQFLIEIGFGKNEAEVYGELVGLGTASVLDLSKRTKIHRSNIYDALRNLVHRGFVYEINQPTKLFAARSPDGLKHYLKQKEVELAEMIKDYESRVSKKKIESNVRITKGIYAVREAIFSLLESGEEIDVYGIPSKAPEIIGPIIKEFHEERIKKKIKMRHIYNSDAEGRAKFLSKMDLTEARVLPSKYDSGTSTNLSGDRMILFIWEGDITVIEIVDKNTAKAYKGYFEILWQKSKAIK